MFVTAKVLYYGILLSAYCCFFQHRSANADTTSTKVALRLDAPSVVRVILDAFVVMSFVVLSVLLAVVPPCVDGPVVTVVGAEVLALT